LYLECQGLSLSTLSKAYNSYDALANDIWSLGIILINLVTGRNPWKQANLQDPAFSAYVKQPRRFFRAILPGISRSFDRILIRIFCLDPAKRITLPELRNMLLGCRSFTTNHTTVTTTEPTVDKPVTPPSSQKQQQDDEDLVQCSKSYESTVMAYIGDYVDEESLLNDSDSFINMCFNTSSGSDTSSIYSTAGDNPPTPRNGSPFFNQKFQFIISKKQQQQQLITKPQLQL
jgi:serine/threonine protein kinase